MTGLADMPARPDLFERLLERLMRWHDPDAERRRAAKYEGTRRRAIELRKRSEVVLGSYAAEGRAVRQIRRRG